MFVRHSETKGQALAVTTKTHREHQQRSLSLLVSLLKLHYKDNQMNIESNKLSFNKIIFIVLIIYLLE